MSHCKNRVTCKSPHGACGLLLVLERGAPVLKHLKHHPRVLGLSLSLHWMQPSLLFSVSLFFLLVCVGTVALSHYGYRNGGVSSPLEVPCRCRLARIGKLLLFSLWRPTITRSARHYECGNIGRNHRPTLLRGLQLFSTLGPSSILQLHPLESIQ